eukprot:gnl/TRDRNA2_/TRDRNA2_201243_c0_seq1.p1 gnl/TRDRNA2_/TRDRNA2_201243_c0~~gnl/TRDRNA2_/TRDRNA2_201243_c0_seq1.p1  ORF type:complete len:286 (-),score=42.41 gnl/TRDRNA2_/TRDRNA2_201243_c0_seq1:49-906(-)
MPILGLGVWELHAAAYQSVRWALDEGYRHIDTAQVYDNEHEVGRAIRDSGLSRELVFIVTKLGRFEQHADVRRIFGEQLQKLGVDYVDLYMLHSAHEERLAAWRELEALYDEGRIRALGVSNFNIEQLEELWQEARVKPVYLQNKFSIYEPGARDEARRSESLMEWLVTHRMVMTGYSVIHPGHGSYLSPLDDPHVKAIASRLGRTPSQVLHRWLLQLGAAVIPRSTKRERIRENGQLFDFALAETDMRLLNGIASLAASSPGRRAPAWCEDIYGLSRLSVGDDV